MRAGGKALRMPRELRRVHEHGDRSATGTKGSSPAYGPCGGLYGERKNTLPVEHRLQRTNGGLKHE